MARAPDGALTVDPAEVDDLAIREWGKAHGNPEVEEEDVPLFAEAWGRYAEQAVRLPELSLPRWGADELG
eukprot:4169951-Alexandrium_andersonii.AAC.1